MEQNERFERIYAETRDALLRYLWARTNAAPEAEDLFQEVYRSLYLRLTRNPLPILDAKRYVFAAAKKALARYYRRTAHRTQNEQPIPEDMALASEDEPIDERLLKEERMDAVWRLLQQEPELNRKIFTLFYVCDRSQKEIGEALGLSERAVRQRLYRTRQTIRAMLEAEERSQS